MGNFNAVISNHVKISSHLFRGTLSPDIKISYTRNVTIHMGYFIGNRRTPFFPTIPREDIDVGIMGCWRATAIA